MWDAFISHASEDKEEIVKPLAEELKAYGAKVWYDEFELKPGDSLSKSIDKGLIGSKYGVVIISSAFINKGWTDYELRSLISKEIDTGKTIIPVWHNISVEEVTKFSLFLKDKYSIKSDIGVSILALKILEVIRPDIANSFAIIQAFRNLKKTESVMIEIDKIKENDIYLHQALPPHMVASVFLICKLLGDAINMDYTKVLKNFAKDADYNKEFIIWNAIAAAYVDFTRIDKIDIINLELKKSIISILLHCSLTYVDDESIDALCKHENLLSKDDIKKLSIIYYKNLLLLSKYFNAQN